MITWASNPELYYQWLLPTMASPFQTGDHDLQPIVIPDFAKARNIGHAYNKARKYIKQPIRVYIHQDVKVWDRHFLDKLEALLTSDPTVGAVGIIGSVVDTGAAFFHTPMKNRRGMRNMAFYPETTEVKLVDGFMLATNLDLPFSEEYETTHMAVEDFCMQVRAQGKRVFVLDAQCDHKSGGTLDDAYWRSVKTFRRKWRHMLPARLPGMNALRYGPDETVTTDLEIDVCQEDD